MRKLLVSGLLLVAGLLLLACQSPAAPVADQPADIQATLAPAAPPATAVGQGDATAGEEAAADAPDPLSVDPARPGFTLDGSATLGAADAPVIIIDFADFQ